VRQGSEWFAPKRYGYGAGTPISWQGWAVTLLYVAGMAVAIWLIRRSPLAFASVAIICTVAFVAVSARTTRGGWKWRWGEED